MLLHIVDKKRYIYADFSGVLWASVKMCEQVSTTSVLFVQGPVLCFVIFIFSIHWEHIDDWLLCTGLRCYPPYALPDLNIPFIFFPKSPYR